VLRYCLSDLALPGRSLSMFSSSTMNINPDIEEAHALRGWYDSIGAAQPFQSHSNAMSGAGMSSGGFDRGQMHSLAYVKNNKLGMEDRVDYFSARATVMHIRSENIAYPACPTQGCNKKVVGNHDGWRCEKCNTSYEKPEYRYVFLAVILVSSAYGQVYYLSCRRQLVEPGIASRFQRRGSRNFWDACE
jgi:ribosomal protein L37AE/L43A